MGASRKPRKFQYKEACSHRIVSLTNVGDIRGLSDLILLVARLQEVWISSLL